MRSSQILVVMTSLPDPLAADTLACLLIEQKLAACVQILAPCQSIYRWHGSIERSDEVPLLIKTTTARYAELEMCIRLHHPYDLPEIIAFPVERGLPDFVAWVNDETTVSFMG